MKNSANYVVPAASKDEAEFFTKLANRYRVSVPEIRQRFAYARDQVEKKRDPVTLDNILHILDQFRAEHRKPTVNPVPEHLRNKAPTQTSPSKASVDAPNFMSILSRVDVSSWTAQRLESWTLVPTDRRLRKEFIRRLKMRQSPT